MPVFAGEVVVPVMPTPGTMVSLSQAFTPAHLKGIVIHPDNALQFDFLIHKGDGNLTVDQKSEEYNKLIKYFLASLTVADKDQWVNLSPYEKNRIVEDNFGKTEMGRDLLAQDYLLKQITSSLMYPESGLGKSFWDKVYAKAYQELGNTNIPVNTFNKVWIVPDQAVIHESGNTALIVKSHLKVMLEEDYLAIEKNKVIPTDLHQKTDANQSAGTAQAIRQIILPELEREVNEGKNFAQLRQVFSGMILATWYKRALKESLLGKVYADKAKVKGIDQNPENNEKIYQQYLQAFKKGVYNYIKEDKDRYTNQLIPRKYFAGGVQNITDKIMDRAIVSKEIIQRDIFNNSPTLDAAMTNVSVRTAVLGGFQAAKKQAQNEKLNQPVQDQNNQSSKNEAMMSRNMPRFAAATLAFGLFFQGRLYDPQATVSNPVAGIYSVISPKSFSKFENMIDKMPNDSRKKRFSMFKGKFRQKSIMSVIDKIIDEEDGRGRGATTKVIFERLRNDYLGPLGFDRFTDEESKQTEINALVDALRPDVEAYLTIRNLLLNRYVTSDAAMSGNKTLNAIIVAAFAMSIGLGYAIYDIRTTPEEQNSVATIKGLFGSKYISSNILETVQMDGSYIYSVENKMAKTEQENRFIKFMGDVRDNKINPAEIDEFIKDNNIDINGDFGKAVLRLRNSNARGVIVGINPDGSISIKEDKAMTKGGIDLDGANLDLLIKRDGKGVPLPLAQQDISQLNEIEGFVPRIIEIRPAMNLSVFSKGN